MWSSLGLLGNSGRTSAGREVRPGLVQSFPLGGAQRQTSGLSLGDSKHHPLPQYPGESGVEPCSTLPRD